MKSLIRERERIAGVVLDDGTEVRAPLVIGADGRHSKVAEMAGLTGTPAPNNRFFYFAYFEDLPLKTGERSQIWFLDPDVAYCFPNEDGLTCAAVMPHKDKLPAFKKDLEGSFLSMYAGIPNAPDFSKAKRIGEFLGMLELPNRIRPASTPGLALIGDAAVTSDPIFGVGCGWALQSAEWLTDDATEAILSRSEARIDEAITTYARHHGERLAMHHNLINGLSRAKPLNFLERSLFTAASRNREIAHQMGILTARLKHPKAVMTPGFIARVLWAARPRWLGGERGRARVAATS